MRSGGGVSNQARYSEDSDFVGFEQKSDMVKQF